jgi:hypothetical protein
MINPSSRPFLCICQKPWYVNSSSGLLGRQSTILITGGKSGVEERNRREPFGKSIRRFLGNLPQFKSQNPLLDKGYTDTSKKTLEKGLTGKGKMD